MIDWDIGKILSHAVSFDFSRFCARSRGIDVRDVVITCSNEIVRRKKKKNEQKRNVRRSSRESVKS